MHILRHACAACGRDGPVLCEGCLGRLTPPPTTRIRGVGRVDALFAYDGAGADIVRGLKFHNARSVIAALADDMAELVEGRAGSLDVLTWLPTSAARRHDRGFDQAELLARAVGRRLGVPVASLLRRRPGPPQTGRSWEQRADNVEYSVVSRSRRMRGTVGVIDDVCTTGATMRAASDVLPDRLRRATSWFALARTP